MLTKNGNHSDRDILVLPLLALVANLGQHTDHMYDP